MEDIMATILGLDVSSSTIGYCLLKVENKKLELLEHNHIKPSKDDNHTLIERLDLMTKEINKICVSYNPNYIVIEDSVQFMANRTTANTIILLSVFNKAVALECYHATNKLPIFLLPVSIRAKIGKCLSIKKINKEDLPDIWENYFGKSSFKMKFKIKGKNKGKKIDEMYDEADAIAAAFAGAIKLELI
jgi:Holliday junction resolvasome RuvABC endonuclease subunit